MIGRSTPGVRARHRHGATVAVDSGALSFSWRRRRLIWSRPVPSRVPSRSRYGFRSIASGGLRYGRKSCAHQNHCPRASMIYYLSSHANAISNPIFEAGRPGRRPAGLVDGDSRLVVLSYSNRSWRQNHRADAGLVFSGCMSACRCRHVLDRSFDTVIVF